MVSFRLAINFLNPHARLLGRAGTSDLRVGPVVDRDPSSVGGHPRGEGREHERGSQAQGRRR
jgi:hypothetical protein